MTVTVVDSRSHPLPSHGCAHSPGCSFACTHLPSLSWQSVALACLPTPLPSHVPISVAASLPQAQVVAFISDSNTAMAAGGHSEVVATDAHPSFVILQRLPTTMQKLSGIRFYIAPKG